MGEVKTVVVPFEVWTEYDYIDQGTYYIVNAMQERVYFKTSDRSAAQKTCNEMYGENFYLVKASKSVKSKSKQENGGYSATGSTTRKCTNPRLKGLRG